MQDMIGVIHKALKQERRTLYRLAKDAGLRYSTVHRFARGERLEINLTTASRLCMALGLELKPVKRKSV
jgi:DNA-binding Xre family transcriptional regulator